MTNSPDRKVYRFSGSRLGILAALAAPAAGAGALVYDIAADEEVPVLVPVAVVAVFAIMFVLVLRLIFATSTIYDRNRLIIKGVFRTHSLAWSEVQDLTIEEERSTAAPTAPKQFAVLYSATGRRYRLPFLTDKRPRLEDDFADLREAWHRGRGETWKPEPAVAAKLERDGRFTPLWIIAYIAALVGFAVGIVLVIAALIAGLYPQIGEPDPSPLVATLIHPGTLLGGLPVIACIASLTFVAVRRRR
jgi:hypothetical protein